MSVENPNSPAKLQLAKTCGILAMAAGAFSTNQTLAAITPPPGSYHTVTLGWNAVPEYGIQSYRLYLGTESQQYEQTIDTGTDLGIPVEGVEFGKTYYFAVSAIDSEGREGPLSSEVMVTIAPPPLPAGGTIGLVGAGHTGLQWSFPRAALGSSPEFVIQASSDLVTWTEVDTVAPSEATGGDAESVRFAWAIEITADRKFFRLTARNWMGESTAQ